MLEMMDSLQQVVLAAADLATVMRQGRPQEVLEPQAKETPEVQHSVLTGQLQVVVALAALVSVARQLAEALEDLVQPHS